MASEDDVAAGIFAHQLGALPLQICFDGFTSLAAYGNKTSVVSFAGHPNDAVIQVEILESRVYEFAGAQSTRVEQLQDGTVAQAEGECEVRRIEQAFHLRSIQS